jgi:polyphenol oxidase
MLQCDFPASPANPEVQAAAYTFPANPQPRHRRCLHAVASDPAALAQLTKAYAAMKNLQSTPDNPLNWCNQANLHYMHCSDASGNYLMIHYGWYFLPWHRAYLYFYESILGQLISDNTFALPYWDWTNYPYVPSPLFDPNSVLNDTNRDIDASSIVTPQTDPEVYNVIRQPFIDYLKGLPTFTPAFAGGASFGGYPDDVQADGRYQGHLEAYPHNAIHGWVGGNDGDMGSFDTAARDILFFAHHANIDRLWDVWRGTNATPAHTNPANPEWANQWFNFWAPDGTPVSNKVSDTVDLTRMNVVYDDCQPQGGAPVARPNVAQQQPFAPAGPPATIGAKIQRQVRPREAGPLSGDEVLIEGVEVPHHVSLRLRVFINKDDATAQTSLDDPHYAGTIFIVPMSSKPAGAHDKVKHGPQNFHLTVMTKATAGLGNAQDARVTLVPVSPRSRKKPDAPAPQVTVKARAATVVTRP